MNFRLGAVRYIPRFFRKSKAPVAEGNENPDGSKGDNSSSSDNKAEIPIDPGPEARGNIDHLNAKIVDKLKAIDSAFSLGKFEWHHFYLS